MYTAVLQSASSHNDVIDFEYHAHDLSGESQGALSDEGRLKNVFFLHVDNTALFHANSCVLLVIGMLVPELSHHIDWVHACVFGKSVRNDL